MRSTDVRPFLLVLGIGACSTVLDIEKLEQGVDPSKATGGVSATGGSGGDGGSQPATTGGRPGAGGKANGGSGGNGTGGGSGGSGTGGASTGGANITFGGEGGEPTGSAGEGEGGAPPSSGDVRGKIIDFWGHAVPNAPVKIGGESAVTKSDGTFEFSGVTTPYDVSFHIRTDRLNHGWVYQGLTRLDPTLQVTEGLSWRGATITFHATGAMHGAPNNVRMAIGGADGSFAMSMSGPDVQSSWTWYGPATTAVTGHALWWTNSTNANSPGPDKFLGYGTATGSATDANAGEITIDLGGGEVDAITLQGSVTRELEKYPTNMVSLRFPNNAVIDLLNLEATGSTFAYQVPDIQEAEIVVAASHGDQFSGPYGVAYEVSDGAPVSLTPPMPVTVISPAHGITLAANTTFEWSKQPGVKVLHIEDNDFYNALFVVTDRNKITLPEAVGFQLRSGGEHNWIVEVHGTASNVDEATGPEGFIDSYSIYDDSPRGPRRGGGSFSYSDYRGFTTP